MIIHSFDYELFIGPKSGTVESCIKEPASRIIKLFDEYKISGEFFVDFGFLIYLNRNNKSLFSKIINHILWLIDHKQNIQFHLHPNWLYGTKLIEQSEEFFVSSKNYYLNHIPRNEFINIIDNCFHIYETYLSKFCNNNNHMIAHRAGGWQSIEEWRLKYIFTTLGIFKRV